MNRDQQPSPGASSDPIQENLQTQFGLLSSEEVPPEELKQEVFQTLDTLNLLADVVDLFTAKFGSTKAEFLDLLNAEDSGPAPDE